MPAHIQGLQQIRDSLGASISNIEAHTPAEQEEALRSYARAGLHHRLRPRLRISATRRAGCHATIRVPIFVITSGERQRGNVVPLVFRIHEATYLAGMLAGAMTHTGKIGFIGGMELPPIKLGYEGWVQGAKAVRPDVETRITYLNTFDDAAAGKEAALAMIRARRRPAASQRGRAGTGRVFGGQGIAGRVRLRRQRRSELAGAGPRGCVGGGRLAAGPAARDPRDCSVADSYPHAESFGLGERRDPACRESGAGEALARRDSSERIKPPAIRSSAGTLRVAGQGVP